MKNCAFFAMLLVLTLLVGQFSVPMAMGEPRATPCQDGNHNDVVTHTEPIDYGGTRYFTVSRCSHVSYSHQHYYITFRNEVTYRCNICGDTKVRVVTSDDVGLGAQCTVYPGGK